MPATSRPSAPLPGPGITRLFATAALACALGVPALACNDAGDEELVDDGAGAQSAPLPDVIATIETSPESGKRLARVGASRYVLTGDGAAALENARRYRLSLSTVPGAAREDGFEVRRVVDSSRVITIVGTLSDDVLDASTMHLRSVRSKSYAIYGGTVDAYKEVRTSLPAHDYTKTLFKVSVVQDHAPSTRWQWLDYAPVPRYSCTQSDAVGTRLDLVDVKPDDSLLDGFIVQPIGGREVRYGAHAECSSDGAAYTCALDSIGTAWGTTRFVPGAGENGVFDLVIERADDAHTKIPFSCATVTTASVIPNSED